MKFYLSSKSAVIAAITTLVITAAFHYALLLPVFHVHLPISLNYVYIGLFIASTGSISIISPVIIHTFRHRIRLEAAVNHYVKNKMQEILLQADLLKTLIPSDQDNVLYEDQIKMLNNISNTCLEVSGNLVKTILDEAPTFDQNTSMPQPKKEVIVAS